MKKLLIFLLAFPLLLNAQISNKKKAFLMAQSGGGTPSTNITSVTFAIDTIKSLDLTTSVDPTTGNSPVYVYVTYRIITL